MSTYDPENLQFDCKISITGAGETVKNRPIERTVSYYYISEHTRFENSTGSSTGIPSMSSA